MPRRNPESNPTKLLLNCDIFKSKSGNGIDPKRVFALGILYCKGKAEEKVNAIFTIHDKNNDGTVFVNPLRKLIKTIISSATILLPALYHDLNLNES